MLKAITIKSLKGVPPGFSRPDYSQPFRLEDRLQGAAANSFKGFLLQGTLNAAKEAQKPLPGERKYIVFKDYSGEEAGRLNVEVARHVYPDVSVQEGLRRLGRRTFTSLSESVLGRVLLGTVGLKLDTVIRAMPRIIERVSSGGKISLVELHENNARLHYKNFYPDFLDCYQIGVLEGSLNAYGKKYEIFLRKIAHGEAEFWGFWD